MLKNQYLTFVLLSIIVCFNKISTSQTTIESGDITQSENSIAIDRTTPKGDPATFPTLVSNNSTDWENNFWPCSVSWLRLDFNRQAQTFFGVDWAGGTGGLNWSGSSHSQVGNGSCDPSTCIDLNGTWFVSGFFKLTRVLMVTFSKNHGASWNNALAATDVGDKPDLWVDNKRYDSHGNPNNNEGYLYAGYRDKNDKIEVIRSTDHGITWPSSGEISGSLSGVKINNGAIIRTGPNGEVYACWATLPCTTNVGCHETHIAFAGSLDGGQTFTAPAAHFVLNINGVSNINLGNSSSMRLNSYPSMAVNELNGDIFITWTQNTSGGLRVWIAKSTDQGYTFNLIGTGAVGTGYNNQPWTDQWFPWIACDETSGAIAVVCYGKTSSYNNVFPWVCYSYDEGQTWTVIPTGGSGWQGEEIPSNRITAPNYAGDYLGIDLFAGLCVPVWSDDATNTNTHNPGECAPNSNQLSYSYPFKMVCNQYPWSFCNSGSPNNYNVSDYAFLQSIQNITAGGTGCPSFTILPTGYATMQASDGQAIYLKPGFTATNGCYFRASITGCTTPPQRLAENSSDDNATHSALIGDKTKLATSDSTGITKLSAVPNPSKGLFTLRLLNSSSSNADQGKTIYIYNTFGQIVYQTIITGNTTNVDISEYPTGVYLVRMESEGKVYSTKIIKQ